MDELYPSEVDARAAAAQEDGLFRLSAASPKIRVGDVSANADAVIAAVERAAAEGVGALVLPELNLTGYTCADLFHDRTLLAACERELVRILDATATLPVFFTVGVPVTHAHEVFNCAAACCAGELLGLTAKANLPTYGEFYERRWFAPAPAQVQLVEYAGFTRVPLGAGLVYTCTDEGAGNVRIGIEVCEDLWVPAPPSTAMATAGGATVILNPSASSEVIGKDAYRRQLVSTTSARLYCAYAYADASLGESTTDLVFAGENLVAENGSILAATKLFTCDAATQDVDLTRLVAERQRSTTWCAQAGEECLEVPFSFEPTDEYVDVLESYFADLEVADGLDDVLDGADAEDDAPEAAYLGPQALYAADESLRVFDRAPFVPDSATERAQRCETILDLQTVGLATRLEHTFTKSLVLGLSGGLDSTLALLVAVRAFDRLGLPRTGVHAVSMPGFGTTGRTKSNAQQLAEHLGVDFREIPIGEAVQQHFLAIGHDPSVQDVTYENSQARERTQILMDLSNELGGFVLGTGDLSELALGWATYNADHMSMYGVNASVPKTLVRHLVAYAADVFGGEVAEVLRDILDTPVSPELLPPTGDGEIAQRTEDLVGPYELHDYFLYYLLRFGLTPGRIYRQACASFEGVYDPATILAWEKVFYRRFFTQQFKRSCLPDGPKVGSVTLSPRGDWRMPSDASAKLWLDELERLG